MQCIGEVNNITSKFRSDNTKPNFKKFSVAQNLSMGFLNINN